MIKYRRVELSASCEPGLSGYKVARVLSIASGLCTLQTARAKDSLEASSLLQVHVWCGAKPPAQPRGVRGPRGGARHRREEPAPASPKHPLLSVPGADSDSPAEFPTRAASPPRAAPALEPMRHPLLGDLEVPSGEDAASFVERKLATIRRAVVRQVSHYFSASNWSKDAWLRQQANAEGWVSLRLVSNFNRIQQLCKDHGFILECARAADTLEVSPCGRFVRGKHAA